MSNFIIGVTSSILYQDSLSEGNQRGPEVTPTPDGAVAFAASVEQSRQEIFVSQCGFYVVQTLRFCWSFIITVITPSVFRFTRFLWKFYLFISCRPYFNFPMKFIVSYRIQTNITDVCLSSSCLWIVSLLFLWIGICGVFRSRETSWTTMQAAQHGKRKSWFCKKGSSTWSPWSPISTRRTASLMPMPYLQANGDRAGECLLLLKRTCITSYNSFSNICLDRDILEVCIKARCDLEPTSSILQWRAFARLHIDSMHFGHMANWGEATEESFLHVWCAWFDKVTQHQIIDTWASGVANKYLLYPGF